MRVFLDRTGSSPENSALRDLLKELRDGSRVHLSRLGDDATKRRKGRATHDAAGQGRPSWRPMRRGRAITWIEYGGGPVQKIRQALARADRNCRG